MSREEHHLGVPAAGGVHKSKLCKQKKVAQRGLGVAQLEKIILEERKRETLTSAINVLPNNSISIPSVSPTHFTPQTLCPNFQSSFPIQIPNEREELEIQEILTHENENWHCGFMWKGEINSLELENHVRVKGPINHDALLPGSPHLQHMSLSSPSLMVNGYPCGSSPFIEPPSNQIIRSNNSPPTMWLEENDKMVGIKRSHPFSQASLPIPNLTPNFLPIYSPSKMRSDELPYKYIRDGPSNLDFPTELKTDADERLKGNFLTLAPPMSASPPSNSKDEHQSYYLSYRELQSTQENVEKEICWIGSMKEEPFYFFLEVNQNGREENGEAIDLSLRL